MNGQIDSDWWDRRLMEVNIPFRAKIFHGREKRKVEIYIKEKKWERDKKKKEREREIRSCTHAWEKRRNTQINQKGKRYK